MRALLSVLLFLLAGTLSALAAAKPNAKAEEPAMRVVVVRSNEFGCEPACSSWISAEGQITRDTPALFRTVLRSIGKTRMPVIVTSGGGNIDSALVIGRMIRERKLDVVVGHTRFDSCPQGSNDCDEKKGRGLTGAPIGFRPYCASACSLILAAGTRRIVANDAYVGVHQIVDILTLVQHQRLFSVRRRLVEGVPVEVSRRLVRDKVIATTTRKRPGREEVYERVARYFKEMGIADDINPLMRATPPESIHWMTAAELVETGMKTDSVEAFQVVELANVVLKAGLQPGKGGVAATSVVSKPSPAVVPVVTMVVAKPIQAPFLADSPSVPAAPPNAVRVATTVVTRAIPALLPGGAPLVPAVIAPGGGGVITPAVAKPTLGSPPALPAPAAPTPSLPAELTAHGVIEAGRFLNKEISLMLRFTWMRGGGSLTVAATAVAPVAVQGITLAPAQFNVTLRPGTARERALIPSSFGPVPTLQGHITRAEFCQLRTDPLLRIAVLPGRLDGVSPRTNYVDVRTFVGMGMLLATVCRPGETASAGP